MKPKYKTAQCVICLTTTTIRTITIEVVSTGELKKGKYSFNLCNACRRKRDKVEQYIKNKMGH